MTRIVGQVDHLRHRVAAYDRDDIRVVVTVCGKRMAFTSSHSIAPIRPCPDCETAK